jgi:hypothetical protein
MTGKPGVTAKIGKPASRRRCLEQEPDAPASFDVYVWRRERWWSLVVFYNDECVRDVWDDVR